VIDFIIGELGRILSYKKRFIGENIVDIER
jgi:hypothetical protein